MKPATRSFESCTRVLTTQMRSLLERNTSRSEDKSSLNAQTN